MSEVGQVSHSHFIEECTECGAVISQCRCASKDKRHDYGICQKCKGLRANFEDMKNRNKMLRAENARLRDALERTGDVFSAIYGEVRKKSVVSNMTSLGMSIARAALEVTP